MSRSGYEDDIEDPLAVGRWRGAVNSALRGKRGQAFLHELAEAMDAMPVRELIVEELVTEQGCCTLGVVCKARGLDVQNVDPGEPEIVARILGIASAMAAEIAFLNDEFGTVYCGDGLLRKETPSERWIRIRAWVAANIVVE